MRSKIVSLFFLASITLYFARNLPPAKAVDITSVIALTSDMRTLKNDKNGTLKEDGGVCVFNEDCVSSCCIYASAASGMCFAKAGIGQICGFVYGGDYGLETHYRICQQCDSYCCCGKSCCPTTYCTKALQLQPYVCTNCNTGCCCNNSCCPITYCVSTGQLKENDIKGKLCLKCQSGCCCGDSCCVSSFCSKGTPAGQPCPTCQTGCCCDNNQCCASSYCSDTSALSVARALLAMFDMTAQQNQGYPAQNQINSAQNQGNSAQSQVNIAQNQGNWQRPSMQQADTSLANQNQGNWQRPSMQQADTSVANQNPVDSTNPGSLLASSLFPVLAPAPLRILGNGFMGSKIKASLCIQCTTGCCCEVGCCSYMYCTVK